MATSWLSDLVAAHVAILQDQATATPTWLRKVYSSQPGSFSELPCAYVGSRNEQIVHDAGTRTRTIALDVYVVDNYAGDNVQGNDRLDDLQDALVDRYDLAANVQRVGSSIIELTAIADIDLPVSITRPDGTAQTTFYRARVFSFGKSAKWEGRQ